MIVYRDRRYNEPNPPSRGGCLDAVCVRRPIPIRSSAHRSMKSGSGDAKDAFPDVNMATMELVTLDSHESGMSNRCT